MSKKNRLIKTVIGSILVAVIAVSYSYSFAQSWQGKVVGVTDGDTIVVFNGSTVVKIRISEIDCPENGQPYSKAAKQFTSDFCYGKDVLVLPETTDKYGRTVAHVKTPEGSLLHLEIVAAGLAWHYKKYSSSKMLSKIEENARQSKRGLWQDNDPVAPWNWRRGIRNSSQLTKPSESLANEFHGNVNSRVFHSSNCKYFNCKNCSATFDSASAAKKQGYRPCELCKPMIAKTEPKQVKPVIVPTANLPTTTSSAVLASIKRELTQADQVEANKNGLKKNSLINRIDDFLDLYCSTYESKILDDFSDLFIPGAKENGTRFVTLLPKYKKNFSATKTINYKIILKDFSYDQNEDVVKINGEFYLQWLSLDNNWKENSGIISMILLEDGESFLVKTLEYQ